MVEGIAQGNPPIGEAGILEEIEKKNQFLGNPN